jgi:hypothetical protein
VTSRLFRALKIEKYREMLQWFGHNKSDPVFLSFLEPWSTLVRESILKWFWRFIFR